MPLVGVFSLRRMRCVFGLFFNLLLLDAVLLPAQAEDSRVTLNINITITQPPQCTIEGGNPSMLVDFEQIHEALIDGEQYKKTINYRLTCANGQGNRVKMGLLWTPSTIDGQPVISTNKPDLGIAVYQGNTRLSPGATFHFNYDDPHPELYAVPVKPLGTSLTQGGDFSGAMTMTLEYE